MSDDNQLDDTDSEESKPKRRPSTKRMKAPSPPSEEVEAVHERLEVSPQPPEEERGNLQHSANVVTSSTSTSTSEEKILKSILKRSTTSLVEEADGHRADGDSEFVAQATSETVRYYKTYIQIGQEEGRIIEEEVVETAIVDGSDEEVSERTVTPPVAPRRTKLRTNIEQEEHEGERDERSFAHQQYVNEEIGRYDVPPSDSPPGGVTIHGEDNSWHSKSDNLDVNQNEKSSEVVYDDVPAEEIGHGAIYDTPPAESRHRTFTNECDYISDTDIKNLGRLERYDLPPEDDRTRRTSSETTDDDFSDEDNAKRVDVHVDDGDHQNERELCRRESVEQQKAPVIPMYDVVAEVVDETAAPRDSRSISIQTPTEFPAMAGETPVMSSSISEIHPAEEAPEVRIPLTVDTMQEDPQTERSTQTAPVPLLAQFERVFGCSFRENKTFFISLLFVLFAIAILSTAIGVCASRRWWDGDYY